MEFVDLFDENRCPLGKIAERRSERKPGEYQTVVHVCLFNREGQLLLQRRSQEKGLWPGLWDVSAAGGVDAGETSRQAAQREFREELGYPMDLGDMRPTFTLHIPRGFDDFYILQTDLNIDELSLQREEVTEVRWADREEAMALLEQGRFVPYHPQFLELLFAIRNGAPLVKR